MKEEKILRNELKELDKEMRALQSLVEDETLEYGILDNLTIEELKEIISKIKKDGTKNEKLFSYNIKKHII